MIEVQQAELELKLSDVFMEKKKHEALINSTVFCSYKDMYAAYFDYQEAVNEIAALLKALAKLEDM